MPGLRYSSIELSVITEHFAAEGAIACAARLPGRTPYGVAQQARKLGLQDPTTPPPAAKRAPLMGLDLQAAVALRQDGWSYARIGEKFGVCEATATNALLFAECVAAGNRPALRDPSGALLPAEIDRLRSMLRAGLKGRDIQVRMGISAGCISNERRRYSADLKARGKRALPPPGVGQGYSGRKIDKAVKREAEALLLQGVGTPKVAARTGISKTQVGRLRAKLVKRLRRKGETLPGCDSTGRRFRIFGSAKDIPAELLTQLRARLLAGDPVSRAARDIGLGSCAAYRYRDVLIAELADRGETLPRSEWRGQAARGAWLPKERIYDFRRLVHAHGAERAKDLMIEQLQAESAEVARIAAIERARPTTFEEKLARVAAGELAIVVVPTRFRDPTLALGNGGIHA